MSRYRNIFVILMGVSYGGDCVSAMFHRGVRPRSSLSVVSKVVKPERSASTDPVPSRTKMRVDRIKIPSQHAQPLPQEDEQLVPSSVVSPKSVETQAHQVAGATPFVPPTLRLKKRRLLRKKGLQPQDAEILQPTTVDVGVGTTPEEVQIPLVLPLQQRLAGEGFPEPDFALANPEGMVARPSLVSPRKKIVAAPVPKKPVPSTADILRSFYPQNEHRTNPAAQVFSIDAISHDDAVFLNSHFLWLYQGSSVGSIPGINPDFIQRFGSPERLNIGGVFSFAYHPVGVRAQVQALERERIESSLQPPSEENNREVARISAEIDRFKQAAIELNARPVFFSQKGIAYQGVYLNFRIDPFTFQPWREDVDAIVVDISLAVRSMDRIVKQKKNVVIADDPGMDKTVMLLACWLMYQGWGIKDALEQARAKRLEHRDLHAHYRFIVNSFAEKLGKSLDRYRPLLFELSVERWPMRNEPRQ